MWDHLALPPYESCEMCFQIANMCAFMLTVGEVYFPSVSPPVYYCMVTSDSMFVIGRVYGVVSFAPPIYSFWGVCYLNALGHDFCEFGNPFLVVALPLFCSLSFIGSFALIISSQRSGCCPWSLFSQLLLGICRFMFAR